MGRVSKSFPARRIAAAWALAVGVLFGGGNLARAERPEGAACDRLAGHPVHPTVQGAGANFGTIPAAEAVAACTNAVAREPGETRYLYNLARAHYAARDDAVARDVAHAAAGRGDVMAMALMASLLQLGRGGPHDHPGAARFARMAADTGLAPGLMRLNFHLRTGIGLTQDLAAAAVLAERAANLGFADGHWQWGLALSDGHGVAKNEATAQEQFRRALAIERDKAEQGNAAAMSSIAFAYERGAGIERDPVAAHNWYLRALRAGDPGAAHALGWLAENGIGGDKDQRAACDWYERAAADDLVGSMNNLAVCHRDGSGRPKDLARAISLFERATAGGNANAPRNLADLYDQGTGVAVDKGRALVLYKLAGERGHHGAMVTAGYMLMTAEGVKGDPIEACGWYERAAERGHARGMNNLGHCFRNGEGRPKTIAAAIGWFEKSASLGDGLAFKNLGDIYELGRDVPKNLERAADYFRRSALAGEPRGMVEYGMSLMRGGGAARDPASGCDWFEKAAAQGDARAMNNLGACFANGNGRRADPLAGIAWYEKAAAKGDDLAMANLGGVYMSGRGIPRDAKRAVAEYRRAVERGNTTAMIELATALYSGAGVDKAGIERDRPAACALYAKAASLEVPAGLNGLAVCTATGIGRSKDAAAALSLFERAAKGGSFIAHRNLARHADRGTLGKKDPEASARWVLKGIAAGDAGLVSDLISYPASWSREARRALQRQLKRAGPYDGPTDGLLTTATDQAIWAVASATTVDGGLKQDFAWVPMDGTPKGLLVRLCRPAGDEPRPLAVINHGMTTVDSDRRDMRPMACGTTARFFTDRGYTAAFPLRRGYGETAGTFSEGGTRVCATSPDFTQPGQATAADIQAVVTHLGRRADIVAGRTLVVGHSGGGWGALALAAKNPAGIEAYINLSGGHGSRRGTPDGVCGHDPLVRSARFFGRSARQPTLWIYSENDSHIGPRLARKLHEGFTAAGGRAKLEMLPPYEDDGHNIFDDDGLDTWAPLAERWLKQVVGR